MSNEELIKYNNHLHKAGIILLAIYSAIIFGLMWGLGDQLEHPGLLLFIGFVLIRTLLVDIKINFLQKQIDKLSNK